MPPQPPTGTQDDTLDDVEEVTAEPVVDGARPVVAHHAPGIVAEPARTSLARSFVESPTGQVVVQAAAVAATGIVAGAATTALVRAARGRGAGKAAARGRGRRDGVEVLETRTYVVDVHVLGRR